MTLGRHVRSMGARLATVLAQGVVKLVDDAKGIQTMQVEVEADETADDVPHHQPYGISFRPPADAECLVGAIGGEGSNLVVFGVQARGARPKGLEEGEGGLYLLGEFKVFLDKDGTLHLGQKDPGDFVALASKVDSELQAIETTLGSLAGQASFATPYVRGASGVGSEKIKAE